MPMIEEAERETRRALVPIELDVPADGVGLAVGLLRQATQRQVREEGLPTLWGGLRRLVEHAGDQLGLRGEAFLVFFRPRRLTAAAAVGSQIWR